MVETPKSACMVLSIAKNRRSVVRSTLALGMDDFCRSLMRNRAFAVPFNRLSSVIPSGRKSLKSAISASTGYIREHAFREKIGIFLEVVNQFRPHLVTDDGYTLFENGGVAYKCKNIKLRTNG